MVRGHYTRAIRLTHPYQQHENPTVPQIDAPLCCANLRCNVAPVLARAFDARSSAELRVITATQHHFGVAYSSTSMPAPLRVIITQMYVVAYLLRRARSMGRPDPTTVPFLLFSAIVVFSLFQPWTEQASGRLVVGTSNGLHYWEGFVVLSLACAAAIMSLLPTLGGSARSRLLLVSTWMLATLLWFGVNAVGSADPAERHPAAVLGGTGLNLALMATVALIGSIAWWKLSVVTCGLARSARASNRPTIFGARHEFSEKWRFVLRRPEPVAIGATLILIAVTQAWTLRLIGDQRGLHSIAGVVMIVAASALIGLAGARLFLRLGDRTYLVAASTAAAIALCAPLWIYITVVGQHDSSVNAPELEIWYKAPYHVGAGYALYATVACAASTLALLLWQAWNHAATDGWFSRRPVLRWPIRSVSRDARNRHATSGGAANKAHSS